MSIQKKAVVLVFVICLLMVGTAVWALENGMAQGGSSDGFITEFPIPQPASNPQNLAIEAAGPPARIWLTMMDADAIGYLVVTSTVDFAFSSYPLPAGSEPFDIVYDDNAGAVWFTEVGGKRIGRLDIATKMITETAVPDGHSPLYIDMDTNGDVWFTEPMADQIVRYQPGSMTFTPFPYSFPGSQPTRIEVLNPLSVWVTMQGGNRVAELDVTDGSFVNIPVNDPGSSSFPPDGLALDSSGPWITAPTLARIGWYSPGTFSFWGWHALPIPANALAYRKLGTQKELWFTSELAGQVGRLHLSASGQLVSFGLYALPTPNSHPVDIAVAADGVAWIVESTGNQVAAWYPPYVYQTALPYVSK